MYNVDGRHSAWMFYIAKCIWGGLLASICSMEVRRQELIFKIYTLVLHTFPSSICHPLHSHSLSLFCFLYKNIYPFFRAEPLLPAPVSSHRTEHNNAQWKCLIRIAECLLISLDEIRIHFTSTASIWFINFYAFLHFL